MTANTRKLNTLKNWDKNPRAIKTEDFARLKNQIQTLGLYKPFLITSDGTVLGGNMRLRACKELGVDEVPVSVVQADTDELKLQYALSDNDRAGYYDEQALAELVLSMPDIDLQDYKIDLGNLISIDELLAKFSGDTAINGSLSDKLIVPPFSVFDTRQGYWQERKRVWLQLIEENGESRQDALAKGPNVVGSINNGVSILDPVLAEIIVKWFCPSNGSTFDVFAGDACFGFVSGYLNSPFLGIELRQEQVALNQRRVDKHQLPAKYVCDDGQNVDKHTQPNSMDLLFSCPPYFDLEVYSELANDASNQNDYASFMHIIDNAFTKAIKALKKDRFAVIVLSDMRGKNGHYHDFSGDVKNIFKRNGMGLYNEIVLINAVGTGAYRANKHFKHRKVVKLHQNILVFYNGDIKNIATNYPAMEFDNDTLTQYAAENT